jgi:low affinity Fe/Cu permease
MWKEKLGNYLIDVSKYVFTGIVISTLFKDFGDSRFLIYATGISVSLFFLTAGLVLTNKRKEDK